MAFVKDLNLEATELRLGLPGDRSSSSNKRTLPSEDHPETFLENNSDPRKCSQENPPPAKAQVVGWPPVRSYRKNCLQPSKKKEAEAVGSGMFIKVSMDGAPFLRKIDLKIYQGYPELLQALEKMFNFSLGKYVPTYEDKDGDWMLVGDVPWEMFITSCKKLRVMKGSEAKGVIN